MISGSCAKEIFSSGEQTFKFDGTAVGGCVEVDTIGCMVSVAGAFVLVAVGAVVRVALAIAVEVGVI